MTISSLLGAIGGAKNAILTGLAVAAICGPLGYCHGVDVTNQKRDGELALANTIAQDRATTTAEQAAVEHVADAVLIAKTETELTDAIADTPDTAPDDVRVQLGCQRLRSQGTAEADLPAPCRSSGSVAP